MILVGTTTTTTPYSFPLAFEGSVTWALVLKLSLTLCTASSRCCPEGNRFDNKINCRYKFRACCLLASGALVVIMESLHGYPSMSPVAVVMCVQSRCALSSSSAPLQGLRRILTHVKWNRGAPQMALLSFFCGSIWIWYYPIVTRSSSHQLIHILLGSGKHCTHGGSCASFWLRYCCSVLYLLFNKYRGFREFVR